MLNKEEEKTLEEIKEKYYMAPIIKELERYSNKHGYIKSLDYLHQVLVDSKDKVDTLLKKRKGKGEIKDISQARKSIAGAAFSNSIIYLFLMAKKHGDIKKSIYITGKAKNNELFQGMMTIHVDGETQKPDMDIVVYKLQKNGDLSGCMIVSLKTSLRERAGQTYRWKLLLEIAATDNDIKKKYDIKYKANKAPLVCFATVNFYDEINNPQHRGMFKFFDKSFIGKPIKSNFISNLSELIVYADRNL